MKNEEFQPGNHFLASLGQGGFDLLLKNRNIFVAGNGWVTYSENFITYGNNIKMAMETLCDVVWDHFSVNNISIFESYIRKLGVEPKKGKRKFKIEASYTQILQLFHDPTVTNYWKRRAKLAEDCINQISKRKNLTGEEWKAHQRWRNSIDRSLSSMITDYNMIKKSRDGSMVVCGFNLCEKSSEFDMPGRKFARVLDKEGINPLLVTYSPSY